MNYFLYTNAATLTVVKTIENQSKLKKYRNIFTCEINRFSRGNLTFSESVKKPRSFLSLQCSVDCSNFTVLLIVYIHLILIQHMFHETANPNLNNYKNMFPCHYRTV